MTALYLLLCEGYGDKCFFDEMLKRLGLASQFHVKFPDRADDPTGGRNKFGSTLYNLYTASPSFRANVIAVLIVSDNDEDPSEFWS